MHYKWPKINQSINTNIQQALLINKQTKETVAPSKQTTDIGITTVVCYFFMIFYIYTSCIFKQHNINNIDGFLKLCTSPDPLKLNTLSVSFQNSERIGTTVFLIIFLALLQGLFSSQNIYTNDPKRAPIIAFNYIFILCWLLCMIIFPSYKEGNTEKISIRHIFLALCVLASLLVNCFLISNLYDQFFEKDAIEPLTGICYALVGIALVCGISMILNGIKNNKSTYILVAYSELICLILFGVFMILFIQFPPLPIAELSCVLVPPPTT